jgi:hypothetical protein
MSETSWLAQADQYRHPYEIKLTEWVAATKVRLAQGEDSTRVWNTVALDLYQAIGIPAPWLASALIRLARQP